MNALRPGKSAGHGGDVSRRLCAPVGAALTEASDLFKSYADLAAHLLAARKKTSAPALAPGTRARRMAAA